MLGAGHGRSSHLTVTSSPAAASRSRACGKGLREVTQGRGNATSSLGLPSTRLAQLTQFGPIPHFPSRSRFPGCPSCRLPGKYGRVHYMQRPGDPPRELSPYPGLRLLSQQSPAQLIPRPILVKSVF